MLLNLFVFVDEEQVHQRGRRGEEEGGWGRGPDVRTNLTHFTQNSCTVCHYQHVDPLCPDLQGDEVSEVQTGSG